MYKTLGNYNLATRRGHHYILASLATYKCLDKRVVKWSMYDKKHALLGHFMKGTGSQRCYFWPLIEIIENTIALWSCQKYFQILGGMCKRSRPSIVRRATFFILLVQHNALYALLKPMGIQANQERWRAWRQQQQWQHHETKLSSLGRLNILHEYCNCTSSNYNHTHFSLALSLCGIFLSNVILENPIEEPRIILRHLVSGRTSIVLSNCWVLPDSLVDLSGKKSGNPYCENAALPIKTSKVNRCGAKPVLVQELSTREPIV